MREAQELREIVEEEMSDWVPRSQADSSPLSRRCA